MFYTDQGCYELDVSGSDSETGSQSESEDEEGISVIISNEVDPANIPLPPSPIPIVISMDSESAQEPPVLDTDQGAAETLMANDSPPTAADADAVLGKTPQQEESPQEIRDTQDESCSTECGRQKLDKGKGREVVEESPQSPISSSDQQCVPQTPPSRISRRAQRTQRRSPKYQPILTIRSSHGWIWNQVGGLLHNVVDLSTNKVVGSLHTALYEGSM